MGSLPAGDFLLCAVMLQDGKCNLVNFMPTHCRGGYHPPAQGNPQLWENVGRIRFLSDMVPFIGILSYPTKAGG